MTVSELDARMSGNELDEWIAYSRMDPFGGERGDLQAGIIASVIANCNRGRRGRTMKAEDFMPKFKAERRRQTSDEMMAILRAHASVHNKIMEKRRG